MAKTLEQKILNRVYRFETRRTFLEIAGMSLAALVSAAASYLLIRFIYAELAEQGTFDLLDLFREDWEIIRSYGAEVAGQFFSEMPKPALTLFIISALLLFFLVFLSIKNRKLIANRLRAIRYYRLNSGPVRKSRKV